MLGEEEYLTRSADPVERTASYVSPAVPPSTITTPAVPAVASSARPAPVMPQGRSGMAAQPPAHHHHQQQPAPPQQQPPQPPRPPPAQPASPILRATWPQDSDKPPEVPPASSASALSQHRNGSTAATPECSADVAEEPSQQTTAPSEGNIDDIMAAVARLEEQGRLVEASALMAKGLR